MSLVRTYTVCMYVCVHTGAYGCIGSRLDVECSQLRRVAGAIEERSDMYDGEGEGDRRPETETEGGQEEE